MERLQGYLYTEDESVWQDSRTGGLVSIPTNPKLQERYFYSLALANETVYADKYPCSESIEKPLLDMSVADKLTKVFSNSDEQIGPDDESLMVVQLMSHDLSKAAMPTAIV